MEAYVRHDFLKDHQKIENLKIISLFTASAYDKLCIFGDFLKENISFNPADGSWGSHGTSHGDMHTVVNVMEDEGKKESKKRK